MKQEMTLKEFLEEMAKQSPMKMLDIARKMIELEGIEQYINICYGVELEIKVRPAEKKEGRFYGKSVIDKLF